MWYYLRKILLIGGARNGNGGARNGNCGAKNGIGGARNGNGGARNRIGGDENILKGCTFRVVVIAVVVGFHLFYLIDILRFVVGKFDSRNVFILW